MYRLILDLMGLIASCITVAGFVRDELPRFRRWLGESAPTDGSEDLH